MPEGGTPSRRGFLEWVLAACSTLLGAGLAFPALDYLWPAARGGPSRNVPVENAEAMRPGSSTILQVGGQAVNVLRTAQGFRAFSAVCTHLGCLVKWNAEKREFLCPCHGGIFDADGKVVAGPPPAPLPEYGIVTVGGKVYVTPPKGGGV